jgi:acetyl-CoA C-acetyltransferase
MCSNIDVDQAAAILLCSYEAARAAGVSDDRMVFPLSGADAHDHWFVTERDRLDASPALRTAARAALDSAGLGIDDVARFDLYSCFPSAVQIATGALDLAGPAGGDDRPLTVTGGLGFAGGPVNNYVSHSIAAMVEECRRDPGSIGLVSGIGWYATKHSVGLYSSDPPARGFAPIDSLQPAIDALARREPAGSYAGAATVEATAVVFDRDGTPSFAIVSTLTGDGRRALANSRDVDTLVAMTSEAWEGRSVTLTTDGTTNTLA